jgi:hypothetical protein
VGLATNWLALKWIFEPVNPTKVGPFILQGQFLRRQKEVAAEFSSFFANRILTSHQVWNSILNDPTTSPSFYALFSRHFIKFANRVTGCLRINVEPEVIQMATNRALTKLPQYVPVLHSYIDKTLGLESTLRVKMEQMTASQFERVLHREYCLEGLYLNVATLYCSIHAQPRLSSFPRHLGICFITQLSSKRTNSR